MKLQVVLALIVVVAVLLSCAQRTTATDFSPGKVVTLRQGVKVHLGQDRVCRAAEGQTLRVRSVKDNFVVGDTTIDGKDVTAFVHRLAVQQDRSLTQAVRFDWGTTTRLEMRIPKKWVPVPEEALELLSSEDFQRSLGAEIRTELGLPASPDDDIHEYIGAWGLPAATGLSDVYITVSARSAPDRPAEWDPKVPASEFKPVLDLFCDDRSVAVFAERYWFLTSEDASGGWYFDAHERALVFCMNSSLAGEERFCVCHVLFRPGARIQVNGYCSWSSVDDLVVALEDAVASLTITQRPTPSVSEWFDHEMRLPAGGSLVFTIPAMYSPVDPGAESSESVSSETAVEGCEASASYFKEDGNHASVLLVLVFGQQLASEMETARRDSLVADLVGPLREELKAQMETELGYPLKSIAVVDSGVTDEFTYVDLSAEQDGEVGGVIRRSMFFGLADGHPVTLICVGNTSSLRAEWREIARALFHPRESAKERAVFESEDGDYRISLPSGWRRVPEADARTVLDSMSRRGLVMEAAFRPSASRWEPWFGDSLVVVGHWKCGRVDEAQLVREVNAGRAQADVQQGAERSPLFGLFKGLGGEVSVLSLGYDQNEHALCAVMKASVGDMHETRVLMDIRLTDYGTVLVYGACAADKWETMRPQFERFVHSLDVESSSEYQTSNRGRLAGGCPSPAEGGRAPGQGGGAGVWIAVAVGVVILGVVTAVSLAVRKRRAGAYPADAEGAGETAQAQTLGGKGEAEVHLASPIASELADGNAVVCRLCSHGFKGIPRRSFLGFLRYTCPRCGKRFLYPLTPGYRATYWVLLAVGFLSAILRGWIPIPGGIGVAMIIALVKDASIRKQIREL